MLLEAEKGNWGFLIDCYNFIVTRIAKNGGSQDAFFEEMKPLIDQLPPVIARQLLLNLPSQLMKPTEVMALTAAVEAPDANDQESDPIMESVLQFCSGF
jgi:hypothetical protein